MSLAEVPVGTTLTFGGTPVAELTEIGAPNPESAVVDVTSHDSGNAREKLPGIIDYGEFTCVGNYIPSDEGLQALRTAMETQGVDTVVVTYPSAYGFSCDAFVKSMPPSEATVDGQLKITITFVVTGAVTWLPES